MFDVEACQRILDAYVHEEHVDCAREGLALEPWFTLPVALQAVVISLQRLSRTDDLRQYVPKAMQSVSGIPYLKTQLQLTLGEVSLEEVLEGPWNAEQLCQFHYYAGARLLTLVRIEEALEQFRKCLAFDVECTERRLAEEELCTGH